MPLSATVVNLNSHEKGEERKKSQLQSKADDFLENI